MTSTPNAEPFDLETFNDGESNARNEMDPNANPTTTSYYNLANSAPTYGSEYRRKYTESVWYHAPTNLTTNNTPSAQDRDAALSALATIWKHSHDDNALSAAIEVANAQGHWSPAIELDEVCKLLEDDDDEADTASTNDSSAPLPADAPTSTPTSAAQQPERFRPTWEWELENDPDLAWLVDEMLPVGGYGELYGVSGTGKSFVTIDLAYCIALGLPWLGHKVTQGAVVYVACEGGSGLKKRRRAWRAAHPEVTRRAPFAILRHDLQLSPDGPDVQELIALLRRLTPAPVLVVLDTLADVQPGDENSTTDSKAFNRAVKQIRDATGAFVLLIHHTPIADAARERGNSAIRGKADVMLGLVTKGRLLELRCTKSSETEKFPTHTLKLEDVPGTGSAVVKFVGTHRSGPESKPLKPHQRDVKSKLESLGPATFSAWKDACNLTKSQKSNFSRIVRQLVDAGHVIQSGTLTRVKSQFAVNSTF